MPLFFQSLAIATVLSGIAPLYAQTDSVRLTLMPESELSFTGTSTLHGFRCQTKSIQAYIDVDSSYPTMNLATAAHPIFGVRIVIPVNSLACGGELEGNMRKTLKADQYHDIIYVLSSYHTLPDSSTESHFVASTAGTLTVAGTTDSISMNVTADRSSDGVITVRGEKPIRMTDFNVTPPTFMHFLHTGNTITVRFTLKATAQAMRAAQNALMSPALSAPAPVGTP